MPPSQDQRTHNNSKKHQINPNLAHLTRHYKKVDGSVLEGSSRSGKTWSSIDFIIYLCCKVETSCTINIIKETFNSFKTTLHDDFNRRLPMFGIYSPFSDRQEVQSFKIFGNKINLIGADKPSKFEGASCDYFWMNEGLDISQDIFDACEQRCRKFWWTDYNPKFTDHWVYNSILKRPNISFLKTVFSDNPGISKQEKKKILSYEPTQENINQGTANDYKWKVYGLGQRAAPEGLIFDNVTWIEKFPDQVERVYFGLDFGYTNDPTSLVRVGVEGQNLYIESLFYSPTENANILILLNMRGLIGLEALDSLLDRLDHLCRKITNFQKTLK